MDFLARREHSFFELKQKLLLKFPDAEHDLVVDVLTRLREEQLQSDDRFAESYVRYRKGRGFGYRHIRADLAARHVSSEILEKHLFEDDADWMTIAADLVIKRIGEFEMLEFGSKQHRKLLRFLESRGFSNLEIRKTLQPRLSSSGNQNNLP